MDAQLQVVQRTEGPKRDSRCSAGERPQDAGTLTALANPPPQDDPLAEFAAVASHDLSAPLVLIANAVELLDGRVDLRHPDVAAGMQGIEIGVARMRRLIDGLLDYGRAASDVKRPEPVECKLVVEETLATLAPAINESGAEIAIGRLPTLRGFPGPLGQLFQNLIINAIKFRGEEPPRIEISCRRRARTWVFAVADNGLGIGPDECARIFDMFARSRTGLARGGSGIGLAVAKQVVERHGGRIWVDSQPGVGSTFRFTIPQSLPNRVAPTIAKSMTPGFG